MKFPSELLSVFPEHASIPKIIHQVYFSKTLPAEIQKNVEKITALNPGWEYRFYDDADMIDFIRSNYGARILAYYNRINKKYGASRADLFRYLLMYKVGGVYIDIKGSLEKPLDQVLRSDDVYLLSRWRNAKGERYEGWGVHDELKAIGGEEYQQWHIIAAAGHPFLRAVIDNVLRNIDRYNPVLDDVGKGAVLRLSGPIAYTLSITPLLAQYSHRVVDGQDDLGLTYSIYSSNSNWAHKSIFRFHYTDLREPVTELTGSKKLVWSLLGPVQIHIIRRTRNIATALSKRFAAMSQRRG